MDVSRLCVVFIWFCVSMYTFYMWLWLDRKDMWQSAGFSEIIVCCVSLVLCLSSVTVANSRRRCWIFSTVQTNNSISNQPRVMPGVVNNSSRQPISLEDLCEYSLHHQPLMWQRCRLTTAQQRWLVKLLFRMLIKLLFLTEWRCVCVCGNPRVLHEVRDERAN